MRASTRKCNMASEINFRQVLRMGGRESRFASFFKEEFREEGS